MIEIPRWSEIITVLLGGLGTVLLLVSALTTESGDIEGLGSMVMALFHFFVVMLALPFLLVAVFRTEVISRWFRNTIVAMSGLNAVLMLISSAAVSGDRSQFVVFGLLELMPIGLLYYRREYVLGKAVESVT